MKMEDRVYKTVVENNLLSEGDTVIVGASGGPDSQFLIHILDKLKNKLGIDIVLAHLNHLHRKEASKDEDLVRQTASTTLGFISSRIGIISSLILFLV